MLGCYARFRVVAMLKLSMSHRWLRQRSRASYILISLVYQRLLHRHRRVSASNAGVRILMMFNHALSTTHTYC